MSHKVIPANRLEGLLSLNAATIMACAIRTVELQ